MIPTAHLRRKLPGVLALVLLFVGLAWGAQQFIASLITDRSIPAQFAWLWLFVFASLAWHLLLAWTSKPVTVTDAEGATLDRLSVAVAIPAYNEDPVALTTALQSLFLQTRRPNKIHVVDDGSTNDLSGAEAAFRKMGESYPDVEIAWTRTVNQGKRHAQIVVFRDAFDADIYATMDSDTILDHECIRKGLYPFKSPRVTSVASVILAYNNRNLFVRLTDSWLLAFQMVVRAAMSRLGAVLVNSGNFSMYRAQVVRDALPAYEHETFLGNTVMFSDDSLLTLFAHLKGRTVQQESSIAFTVLPERLSHHMRQQVRWMRGSTIRSMWRFRYLPLKGWAYWEHLLSWVNFILITIAFVVLIVIGPLIAHQFAFILLAFSIGVCYITALRYLVIARSDQSLAFQLGTMLLSPIMLAWTALVLRPMRIYSILTCWKTGWGTRSAVEVTTAA